MSLEKLIAFLFQTTGKERLSEKEIYMILSFKLGWLTPAGGREAIKMALEKNLIKKEGEEIIPNFDYRKIDIPFEFKFDEKMLEMEENLLSKIIRRIERERNLGRKRIEKDIEEVAGQDIYEEIAALVVAHRYGVEIDDLIDDAWKIIKG